MGGLFKRGMALAQDAATKRDAAAETARSEAEAAEKARVEAAQSTGGLNSADMKRLRSNKDERALGAASGSLAAKTLLGQ